MTMYESLQESINNMKEMFHKRMVEFEAELPRTPGTPSLSSLSSEYNTFKTFVMEALSALQRQIQVLAHNLDALEMRGRRKMLLLHGVPEEKKEDTAELLVAAVNKHLKSSNLTAADIRRCHRMGRPSTEHKPRPIVVKFQNISIRDRLWFAKTQFKGSGITVSEFLTKQRHETFMAARQKFGLSNCWTKKGYIHLVGADGSRHRIVSVSELESIQQQQPEKTSVIPKPAASKSKRAVTHKK